MRPTSPGVSLSFLSYFPGSRSLQSIIPVAIMDTSTTYALHSCADQTIMEYGPSLGSSSDADLWSFGIHTSGAQAMTSRVAPSMVYRHPLSVPDFELFAEEPPRWRFPLDGAHFPRNHDALELHILSDGYIMASGHEDTVESASHLSSPGYTQEASSHRTEDAQGARPSAHTSSNLSKASISSPQNGSFSYRVPAGSPSGTNT